MAMEFDDCKNFVVWNENYEDAIRELAALKFEAVNSELSEQYRFNKYNHMYVGGFQILKLITGKDYATINRDIVDAYNSRYNK